MHQDQTRKALQQEGQEWEQAMEVLRVEQEKRYMASLIDEVEQEKFIWWDIPMYEATGLRMTQAQWEAWEEGQIIDFNRGRG